MPLYGQDLTDETNPLEAGLSWAVKLDAEGDFVGKAALIKIKQQGLTRRLRGLIVQGKGIIRTGCPIFVGEQQVGEVTSGSYSISLDKSIGLGYVDLAHVDAPTKPFYKR
jgi:aminomethyltransferase